MAGADARGPFALVEIGVQARARSLAEIAHESSGLEDFGRHVRDFLHEWNRTKREEKELAPLEEEEPRLLASSRAGAQTRAARRTTPRFFVRRTHEAQPSRRAFRFRIVRGLPQSG